MTSIRDYPIDEDLRLGLDVGIASCGSALLRIRENAPIIFMGSRCFEIPEIAKTRKLKNAERREKRSARRTIRRRRQRLQKIRALLNKAGFLSSLDPDDLHANGNASPNPWIARAEGLNRRLTEEEFSAALIHIAKHRGFKSSRKSDVGNNAPDDNKKMLSAIAGMKERVAQYRTVGEMLCLDERFRDRKRNRTGDYSHTVPRDLLVDEVWQLFKAQQRYGESRATPELASEFGEIAFSQGKLQDSEHMVGVCPFEKHEKRSSKHAYSFELFRYLSRLNTLTLRKADGSSRRLTREELSLAARDFGAQQKITFKTLRAKLGISADVPFEGLKDEKEQKDVCASAGSALGTATLREVLGPTGWNALVGTPEILDRIAFVITFRDDFERLEAGLRRNRTGASNPQCVDGRRPRGKIRPLSRSGPHICRGRQNDRPSSPVGKRLLRRVRACRIRPRGRAEDRHRRHPQPRCRAVSPSGPETGRLSDPRNGRTARTRPYRTGSRGGQIRRGTIGA